MAGARTRVLIVDDSPVVRAILRGALQRDPQCEVVGVAADGLEAIEQIQKLRPDVVTLDVEMPRLNGLGVLERIGGKLPIAFLVCSTLTQAGARVTLEALRRGAFDYIAKPEQGLSSDHEFQRELCEKVRHAAAGRTRVRKLVSTTEAVASGPKLPPNRVRGWVVGIGISCGGPQTLHQLLPAFPSDFVPIVVTQHMPAQFTGSFASHLAQVCAMKVREARDGETLEHGVILIAPGSHHLTFTRVGLNWRVRLDDGPKVSGHKPSADAMFASLAKAAPGRAVGVVMTGMGHDGAAGIRLLRQVGCPTLAQDAESSLVFGMPKAAAETGCVDHVASLSDMPLAIARTIQSGRAIPGPALAASERN